MRWVCETDVAKMFPFSLCAVYQKEAEADVAGDTSGAFKRLLVGCLQANRPEGQEFDRNKAKQDAQGMLFIVRWMYGLIVWCCVYVGSVCVSPWWNSLEWIYGLIV